MFIKLTRSGERTCAQLVKSFRDEHGKPQQRTMATLGRSDEQGGQVDSLLNGLMRAKGRTATAAGDPQVRFESALCLGCLVWALGALWHALVLHHSALAWLRRGVQERHRRVPSAAPHSCLHAHASRIAKHERPPRAGSAWSWSAGRVN